MSLGLLEFVRGQQMENVTCRLFITCNANYHPFSTRVTASPQSQRRICSLLQPFKIILLLVAGTARAQSNGDNYIPFIRREREGG